MKLKDFAREIGVSLPTVSRVLNHCFGVDEKTRAYVREEARRRGLLEVEGATDIYCILPDVPTRFWRPAYEGLVALLPDAPCSTKFNVYSRLNDEEAVLTYLEQAHALRCRALIVAAQVTPRIRAVLAGLAEERLVILLNRRAEIPNTFYVGEDPFAAGRQLGKACGALLRRHPRVMTLTAGDGDDAVLRRAGFWEVARLAGAEKAGSLSADPFHPAAASRLARQLAECPDFDCVYCDNGLLPLAALAVEKLRRGCPTPCIGHDCPESELKYRDSGAIAAYTRQDPATQGRRAMALAREYCETRMFPPGKWCFLPTDVWVHPAFAAANKKEMWL